VECVERGLNPLTTNLVVADATRTSKTICLAVSPSLKAYGIGGRARLFEVEERVRQVNDERLCFTPDGLFRGRSWHAPDLQADDTLAVDYIVAPPRMAYYMRYSTRIYKVYLRYFAPEDIHVYSIDEVFIDATDYLATYRLAPRELATKLVHEVLAETGITATAGIGTNLYLCKVAMDIVAKHLPADEHGVRVAELDEDTYRRTLWGHRPLTDFWHIGRGTARKLEAHGMTTLGEVARRSLADEDLFYRLFGVHAEFVIDHAWGYEPLTMADIKAYRPQSRSLSSGQVLTNPYEAGKARVVVREMAMNMALELVDKELVTPQVVLTIGYDHENLTRPDIAARYHGPVTLDHYGRPTPKHAHGTANMKRPTSSSRHIADAIVELYDQIVDPALLVRRLNVAATVMPASEVPPDQNEGVQLDLFADNDDVAERIAAERKALEREHRMQKAMIAIKKKYGKNALLNGTNFMEGATARERNKQIGGHKA